MRPGTAWNEEDPYSLYWIREDGVVMCAATEIRGADPASFVCYLGGFAKDDRNCYSIGRRLKGANPAAFHALNNTFYKDDRFVWTSGGQVKDALAESFVVCDSGIVDSGGLAMPYGYGKDAQRVFYNNFHGPAKWVRKADPATFVSLDDGHFARDDQHVFCEFSTIAKADARTWEKLAGYYSRDARRVFYFSRVVEGADPATFTIDEVDSTSPPR
jgi:hypothetical protein